MPSLTRLKPKSPKPKPVVDRSASQQYRDNDQAAKNHCDEKREEGLFDHFSPKLAFGNGCPVFEELLIKEEIVLLEDQVLYSSDYPHGEALENAARNLMERQDVSEVKDLVRQFSAVFWRSVISSALCDAYQDSAPSARLGRENARNCF